MSEVTVAEKLPENDLPVTIEGDNWIGANAIILKGVTVGDRFRCCGWICCDTQCTPIQHCGGVPAKVISELFSPSEIQQHEKALGIKK